MTVLWHYWALSEGVSLISTVPEPFTVSCALIRPQSLWYLDVACAWCVRTQHHPEDDVPVSFYYSGTNS